ncbi:hypothetical protein PMAYCL1PPCAC_31116, partial [Pristionchus mayeri]
PSRITPPPLHSLFLHSFQYEIQFRSIPFYSNHSLPPPPPLPLSQFASFSARGGGDIYHLCSTFSPSFTTASSFPPPPSSGVFMSSLLRTAKTREEESEEDLKVAVILTMVEMLEEVSHIQPEQKVELPKEPKKKREFDPSDFKDPILFIDDMSYCEEKEIKRLMSNCGSIARKVTFSDPIDRLFEFPPAPPPTVVQRTLSFIRKVGRLICIIDNSEEEFEMEEEESFLDYKSYGFT